MRLSTKIRYGYRLMIDLAIYWGKGPIALKEISDRQQISLLYLRQIIMSLEAAGLVKSHRGSKGGYSLSRAPEEINLADISTALEGPLSLLDCIDDTSFCARSRVCAARLLWKEMSEQIEKTLSTRNLAFLRDNQVRLDTETYPQF